MTGTTKKEVTPRTYQSHPFLANLLQSCPIKNVPVNGALVNLRREGLASQELVLAAGGALQCTVICQSLDLDSLTHHPLRENAYRREMVSQPSQPLSAHIANSHRQGDPQQFFSEPATRSFEWRVSTLAELRAT